MPEPLAEHLSRFTPDASGLDREALLIAAGRASARPNRAWRALTCALAGCQLLTLLFLWQRPSSSVGPLVTTLPASTAVEVSGQTVETWAWDRQILQSDGASLPRPATVDDLVPDAPPLLAFAGRAAAEPN